MNAMQLLDALDSVQEPYILSAAQCLYGSSRKRASSLRRLGACAAAVLLVLSLSFGTALAVSADFRAFIYSFFRAEEPEVVPQHTSPIPDGTVPPEDKLSVEPEKILIGAQLEGTYVHTPVASHARNGLFLICTDEVMMNSGNHYDAYREENGTLVKLAPQTFCQDYTVLGNTIHVEFQWVDAGGHCVCTYVDSDAPWRKPNLSGPLEATLFTFTCQIPGAKYLTNYPVLIDLNTGELTDILAGTGAETLDGIYQAAISDDLTRMVLVTHEKALYYVDISAKKLYSVDALSGEHAEECVLTDTTLTCWVLEGDSIEDRALGTYRAWAIDLETLERRELFRDLPATPATSHDVWSETAHLREDTGSTGYSASDFVGLHFLEGFSTTSHWGNMYCGSDFALEVDESRNVRVMDLATGERHLIDGFTWPETDYPDVECIPCPDGKKLLIQWRGEMTHYDQIGVLDFESRTYFEFSRENLNQVNEHTIYWFDRSSILIATTSHEEITDYYVYRLLN